MIHRKKVPLEEIPDFLDIIRVPTNIPFCTIRDKDFELTKNVKSFPDSRTVETKPISMKTTLTLYSEKNENSVLDKVLSREQY